MSASHLATARRPVFVTGVAASSEFGAGWRGLAAALVSPTESAARTATFPGVPPEAPLANPKARNARKMMSRGAYLAATTLAELMRDVRWTPEQRELAGYFLGVGASGGSLDDVTALLDASIVPVVTGDGVAGPGAAGLEDSTSSSAFSLAAFGNAGLAACNPLLAFQLMNNFTLAHGAIFEGLGGPNGALFSRGSGTTAALVEAFHAIASGDCEHAVAGGADSVTHAVTRAELAREGFLERGLRPSEGAAVLALSSPPSSNPPSSSQPGSAASQPLGVELRGCAIASGRGRPLFDAIDEAVEAAGVIRCEAPGPLMFTDVHAIVIAGWGPPAVELARRWATSRVEGATIVDTGALGSTLAAGAALGWAAAIDLATDPASVSIRGVLAIDIGVDGDAGAVLFRRAALAPAGGVA